MESISSKYAINSTGPIRADGNSRIQVGNNEIVNNYYASNSSNAEQCLADLRQTDPDLEKMRIEDAKGGLLRDSYKWIIDHEDFQRWKNNAEHRLLWIKGDAGKGKTMLLCGIINELRQTQSIPPTKASQLSRPTETLLYRPEPSQWPEGSSIVCFFFCQGTDSRLNDATGVLRGLMYILLYQRPCLMSHIQKKYDLVGRKIFEGSNAFYALSCGLVDMLHDPLAKDCYLVIDALDECKVDRQKLLKFITKIISTAPHGKWLVSSRQLDEIGQELSHGAAKTRLSLELNPHHVSQAIDAYINDRIPRLVSVRDNESLKVQIRDELRDKANGTFLWVALVIHRLQDVEIWNMRKVIQQTPAGLTLLYKQMMSVIQNLEAESSRFCYAILSTASVVYRPLHLKEIGLLSGLPSRVACNAGYIEKVVHDCGSLLTIRDGFIYLIHQSVKDFFISNESGDFLKDDISVRHHRLFQKSLEALTNTLARDIYNIKSPGILCEEIQTPEINPLVPIAYSCIHCVYHLRDAIEMGAPNALDEIREDASVHKFICTKYLHWLEALSLQCSLPTGETVLSQLQGIADKFKIGNLMRLVQDARRFLDFNKRLIASAPLQVYASALLFSPTESIIRGLFVKEMPQNIAFKSATETHWNECLQTLEGHIGGVISVAFSADGRFMVSGSLDGKIKIWDFHTRQCMKTLEDHESIIRSVAVSADGQTIVSGSWNGTIKIWDFNTGQCLQTLKGHKGYFISVDISVDGQKVASGSNDTAIRVWDTVTGKCVHILKGHTECVRAAKFSIDNQQVISISSDYTVKVWKLSTGTCVQTLQTGSCVSPSLGLAPDGRRIVTRSFYAIKIWDLETGKCVQEIKIFDHREYRSDQHEDIAFSSDGQRIASGQKSILKVWDISTGQCLRNFTGHSNSIAAIAFSPDGQHIISGSYDNIVKIWGPLTNQSVNSSEDHNLPSPVSAIVLSVDGCYMACGTSEGNVEVWDILTSQCLQNFKGHSGCVSSIAISMDAQLIASGSWSKVNVWDMKSSQSILSVEGHGDLSGSVAFSTDGARMASASKNKSTRVWDITKRECIRTFKNDGTAKSIAFSSDGKRIVLSWDPDFNLLSDFSRFFGLRSNYHGIEVWDIPKGRRIQKLKMTREFRVLCFDAASSDRLVTNVGIICLDLLPIKGMRTTKVREWHLPSTGYEIPALFETWNTTHEEKQGRNSWIVKDGVRLVWLPGHYRPSVWTVMGTTLAICSDTGHCLIMKFSSDRM